MYEIIENKFFFNDELTTKTTKACQDVIVENYDSIDIFEFDLSQCSEFDTIFLQFLVSMYNSAEKDNKKLIIKNPTESVQQFFKLYDLEYILDGRS
jgi:ABC-type transporter Mla MlaB component